MPTPVINPIGLNGFDGNARQAFRYLPKGGYNILPNIPSVIY